MKKNLFHFLKESIGNFLEAVVNLFIFFPYFFSLLSLSKTLFSPWKNLVISKTTRGFSFQEWFERLAFNFISRMIGFFMRLSVILFYFLILFFSVVFLPFIFLIFIILTPLLYLKYYLEKTDSEKEELLRKNFTATHLMNQVNYEQINKWFDHYYITLHFGRKWWKLSNLFTYPPLARDWAVGYTPFLDRFVEDLTSTSYQALIKSAFDREKEINQIERILSKSEEKNVIIVGDEGVGKHTIVDSLAKKIYEGKVNNLLAYKRVLKINLEKILDQSIDQEQRESLLENLLEEAAQAKNVILLIENFDKYVSSQGNRIDLTLPIEKYAKTDRLQIIGITQPFLYQEFIFQNQKISHLFEKVDVYEIKKDEAEEILLNKAIEYERRYQVTIPYETVKNLIDKSDFFITYIPFPEKAIVLLDSICVYCKEKKLPQVNPELVDKILTEKTHIPTRLTDQLKEKLVNLESLLSSRIVQQKEAIDQLSSAIRRSFLLIGKRKKPLASFLFLGPTGVGKTETAKTIAQLFFGSQEYLIRFDMSLYQTKEDIHNLIGSLDSGKPGLLTSAIREKPYGVLLLDEIEKADRNLINIFLTLTDEGYFVDGFGKRVDAKNLVVIATSNAGGQMLYSLNTQAVKMPVLNDLGGAQPDGRRRNTPSEVENTASSNLIDYLINKRIFTPEFLNRFDGVIVYKPLSQQALVTIAKTMLDKIKKDIFSLYKVNLEVSDQLINQLVVKTYDPRFGARNLERTIRTQIEDTLAKIILQKQIKEGETISL